MPARYFRHFCLLLCLLSMLLSSCGFSIGMGNSGNGSTPVTSATPDAGPRLNVWTQVATGVETRYEHWKGSAGNQDTISIVRLNPHHIHLSIGYQPDTPLSMADWMSQTHALAAINGGYFDKKNHPIALLVSDGQVMGTSYEGFGGMLAVDKEGTITLRSLNQHPYSSDEQLQQATQSWPMLILNGQVTNFQSNGVSDRRSVVAIDNQGRLLFIASPSMAFSLSEFADQLAASDLSIQTALNLDGGASTSLYTNGKSSQDIAIDPLTFLPIVILVK